MSTAIMPQRIRPPKAHSVRSIQKRQDEYALQIDGERGTNDQLVRQVYFIVEDWLDMFDVDRLRWRTILTAITSDALRSDAFSSLESPVITQEDYRAVAEWRLCYVLNHLEGSGLTIVKVG